MKRPAPLGPAERRLLWGAVGALLALAVLAYLDAFTWQDGEPLALGQGVSAWPTLLLRVLLIALGIGYVLAIRDALAGVEKDIEAKFGLAASSGTAPPPTTGTGAGGGGGLLAGPRRLWRRLVPEDAVTWYPSEPHPSAQKVWIDLKARGGPRTTMHRVFVYSLLYSAGAVGLFMLFRWPSAPTRGTCAWIVNAATLYPCLFLLIFLNVAVFDAASSQVALVRNFTLWDLSWPAKVEDQCAAERGVSPAAARAWLVYDLLTDRTQVIEKFIYYPCVALLVMIVIHNPVFDDFTIPASLLFVYGTCFLGSVLAGHWVSRATARARAGALARVEAEALRASVGGDDSEKTLRALERLKAGIKKQEVGSFSSLVNSPTLRALLIPGGGMGLLGLMEYFLRAK